MIPIAQKIQRQRGRSPSSSVDAAAGTSNPSDSNDSKSSSRERLSPGPDRGTELAPLPLRSITRNLLPSRPLQQNLPRTARSFGAIENYAFPRGLADSNRINFARTDSPAPSQTGSRKPTRCATSAMLAYGIHECVGFSKSGRSIERSITIKRLLSTNPRNLPRDASSRMNQYAPAHQTTVATGTTSHSKNPRINNRRNHADGATSCWITAPLPESQLCHAPDLAGPRDATTAPELLPRTGNTLGTLRSWPTSAPTPRSAPRSLRGLRWRCATPRARAARVPRRPR